MATSRTDASLGSRSETSPAVSVTTSLAEVYDDYFDIVRATTPGLLDQAYRLRFQVYCVENGFEDPAHFPDGLEHDAFDDHAVHSLLTHRPTGTLAGTVRLILPAAGTAGSLPIQRLCPDPSPFPVARTGEVSRFSISREFRRRRTDGLYPDEHRFADTARQAGEGRLIPSMTIGLIRDLVRISVEYGITHWCAVMMPSLLRLLQRLGIHFIPAGPLVEYHGKRQPCYRELNELLEQVHTEQPEVWAFLTDEGRTWPLRSRRASAAGPGQ